MAFKPVKERPYGEAKAVVAHLFEEAGGVPTVMEILDLSRTRVYALADPDSTNDISYARMAKLTSVTGATAAAKDLAFLAGGIFMPLDRDDDDNWLSLAGEASKRHARNISKLMDSLSETERSPGVIDEGEAREILEVLDQQLSVLARQRAKLARIAGGEPDIRHGEKKPD